MSLEVCCRTCGQSFTPEPADVRAGTWRLCRSCRPPPDTPARHRAYSDDLATSPSRSDQRGQQ